MDRIESLDDPRVTAYRDLPQRTARGESVFVTEGRLVTRRLLRSDYETESVFVAERFVEEFDREVDREVPLYVAGEGLLREVVGFDFHLGVLGSGRRRPTLTLDQLASRRAVEDELSLVICPELAKQENLGLIFRSAAALGVDGIVLGRGCCDPFSRRMLRVSMGAVLEMPFAASEDFGADLKRLKNHWGVELLAAVLDDRAEPLPDLCWPRRAGILFGSEYEGIRPEWLSLCDRLVTIPMAPNVDSFNLGVAAGIFIYEMKRHAT
jgi:tRNA G18 (ribose-2'-O)-methylase SpoU